MPALVWLAVTAVKKQPALFIAAAFFAAAAAVVLSVTAQQLLRFLMHTRLSEQPAPVFLLFQSFISAALIEEGVKAALFRLLMRSTAHIRQRPAKQLILIAVFFALVFSGFENISYAIRYPQFRYLRLITASVLHGSLGIFYTQGLHTKNRRQLTVSVISAALLHGLYNVFVSIGGIFTVFSVAVIGITVTHAVRNYR